MQALIQLRGAQIATINGFAAFLGLRERGREIAFFEAAGFAACDLSARPLVVGGAPIIMQALQRMGIPFPALPSVPEALQAFARRRIWHSTLAEVRARVDAGQPVFAKPAAHSLKQFAGHVAANYADLALTAHLDDACAVVCAEVLDMRAEYRAYVVDGQIVGCKHYWGDFRLTPDFQMIDAAVAAFRDGPRGYAIDFAVLADGSSALIEVNDGFALGSYGLTPMLYASLLEARWQELTLA